MRALGVFLGGLFHQVVVLIGAGFLTLGVFLLLPVMQRIADRPEGDLIVTSVDAAYVPPPPPPPEEEPEEEPEPEEAPPELDAEVEPLSLDQLSEALNFDAGGAGWFAGEFAIKLPNVVAASNSADAIFSGADLDQPARATYRTNPTMDAKMRRRAPGKVWIIFVVDERGRVQSPKVQSSTDPVFEKSAMAALKKWRFDPGKRNGKPVSSRMRIPITFPGG